MTIASPRKTRAPARIAHGFVDCDVHNALPSPEALRPYLPKRWHDQYFVSGPVGAKGFDTGRGVLNKVYFTSMPRPHGYRPDADPPSGGPAGSDFDFLVQDLLETWPVEKAILVPLESNPWPRSGALSGALHSALNDWTVAEWLGRDARIYGAIAVPIEDGPRAAREIERMAPNRRFVQVELSAMTRDPLGNSRYWPIYEAAAAAGLPVSIHVGIESGNPVTSAGWPSYHYEKHCAYPHAFQAQVISLLGSGIFKAFPDLKIVLVEGGFAWIAPLIWRLDRLWRLMGKATTHLEASPSELIRKHFWFTTQPIDVSEDPADFMQGLEHLDHMGMADRIMLSTDYPHFDFDSPDEAFPPALSGDLKDRIYRRNAEALFRFA